MITPRDAKIEKLRRLASRDLLAFYQYVWWMPSELKIGRHTRELCRRLTRAVDDFLEGKNTYLVVNMPFRHGKSDLVSRALPAFFIGRCAMKEPNVLMSGYGSSLVKGFSMKVRDIVQSEAYARVFPLVKVDPDKSAADEWKVKDSQSTVYAQGLGGSITGKGGNLIIVDDYCKNRQEAESKTVRDTMFDSFKDDFCSRTNAPAHIIIVCATRWHEDDIVGRLKRRMEEDPTYTRWEFLVFPARKEGPDGWDTLFPELYDKAWYEFQRKSLGPYSAAALLDCDPRTAGTVMFQENWLQFSTGNIDQARLNIHFFVDGAKSKSSTADFTTIWVIGRGADGGYYLIGGAHARMNLAEKIRKIFELGAKFHPKCIWWEQVGAMSDVEALKMAMDAEMFHMRVKELNHNTNKDYRIRKLVVPFCNGQIHMPPEMKLTRKNSGGQYEIYDMVNEFIETEYKVYSGPESTPHDDMLDCLADIMDDEVLKEFLPPQDHMRRTWTESDQQKRDRGRLFAR